MSNKSIISSASISAYITSRTSGSVNVQRSTKVRCIGRTRSANPYVASVEIASAIGLNVYFDPGELVPMPTSPADVMRRRSVGELAPSAVVENTRRPGMSLAPGVPSTWATIRAAQSSKVQFHQNLKNRIVPA
jgi:hypothetical protein